MAKELSNKKFMELVDRKVRKTIRKYKLFTHKEKIGVAVSGGKDSTVCLYLMKKLGYDVEAITINSHIPNYNAKNIKLIKQFCKKHEVPLHIYTFKEEIGYTLAQMRSILKKKGYDYASCMLCGIMKRYIINKASKELKLDAVVTGHNLDDFSQTIVMNMFRNDWKLAVRQKPISGIIHTKNFVKRAKPLLFIAESDLKKYAKIMKFPVNYDTCPVSHDAFRMDFKKMLNSFEKKYPSLKYNIAHFHETMLENLKEQDFGEIGVCKVCGEPSSQDECKTCVLIKQLDTKKKIVDKTEYFV